MKRIFKPLLLVLFLSSFCSNPLHAQAKTVSDTFIGQWQMEDASVKIVIFKDRNDEFQMVAWDSSDGEEFVIERFVVEGNLIKTTEKMPSTNWITYNTYTIVDENKLKNVVNRDPNGDDDEEETVLYLTREK